VGLADGVSRDDRDLTGEAAQGGGGRRGPTGPRRAKQNGRNAMAMVCARIRLVVAALAVLIFAAAALPVAAQQPNSVNPNGAAVKEQQLLDQLHRVQGLGTIPDAKSYVIEQPQGREWRLFHEVYLQWIGGVVILGAIAVLLLFFFIRGVIRIEGGRSGRTIQRFNVVERLTHWTIAISFVILGLTGLNISFGKSLLLPLIGPDAFSSWSLVAKYLHDYSSIPFVIGVLVLFLIWVSQNLFTRIDFQWFAQGGGMVGHKHPPAYKFNGGQKLLFWLVVLATIGVALSGFSLLFPFYLTNILGMQTSEMVHAVIAMLFIGLILAHIYIGTLGMEGGFEAMGTGDVDLNWAKQHHALWVELGQGRAATPPAGAAATPAE
jgi:formate dehydrogenase subunit gamma